MQTHGSLALLLVAIATGTPAGAGAQPLPGDGVWAVRDTYDSARPGSRAISMPGGVQWVRLGTRVAVTRAIVSSRANSNASYEVLVEFRGQRGECGSGVLVVGDAATGAAGDGGGEEPCRLRFEMRQVSATRAASMLGVTRRDRAPVGEQVTGAFRAARAIYRRGQVVEIVLTLANPARAPWVSLSRGAWASWTRRGPFSFRVTRDGVPVEPVHAFGSDEPGGYAPLAPGTTTELRVRLAPWTSVSVPGRYVVECTWEGAFVPSAIDARDASHNAAAGWDRELHGTARFEVR